MPSEADNVRELYTGRALEAVTERLANATRPGPPLQPPGGGGTFDGMEARVAVLEADVKHIQADVSDIKQSLRAAQTDLTAARVDIARIDERTKNLPTLNQTISIAAGLLLLLGAVTVFQDNIKRALGAGAAPSSIVTPTPKKEP